jgi:hypothetical protein
MSSTGKRRKKEEKGSCSSHPAAVAQRDPIDPSKHNFILPKVDGPSHCGLNISCGPYS